MKRFLSIIFLPALLMGCSQQADDASVYSFSRDDIKQVKLPAAEPIELEDTYNDPIAHYLMNDDLVLVSNQQHCDTLFEVFSLSDGHRVMADGTKGNGPGEFIAPVAALQSSNDRSFSITDAATHTYYVVDIKSTLQNRKLSVKQEFKYSGEIHPSTNICMTDDKHYAGYQMWYMNDSTYNNNKAMLKLYDSQATVERGDDMSAMMNFKYFVSNVNGGQLIYLPETKRLWVADMHKDCIYVYDDTLGLVKTIQGPDNYKLKYQTQTGNVPITFVNFSDGKDYLSFQGITRTAKYVYLTYVGMKGGKFDPHSMPAVEVVKFDLSGTPLCIYQTDRFLTAISVDSKDEYLYATARRSSESDAEFVRYKLK